MFQSEIRKTGEDPFFKIVLPDSCTFFWNEKTDSGRVVQELNDKTRKKL